MPRKSPHPHVSWRAGRPRFNPARDLRARGHAAKDLKHPDGRWFTKGEAVDWALAFAATLAAQPKLPLGRPPKAAPKRLTLGKMVEAWQATARWQDGPKSLSPRTRKDYRQKLKVFQDDYADLWVEPAEAISRPTLQVCYDELCASRGLATARGSIVVLQACYKWAITRGRIRLHHNPAQGLEKEMPAPRIRFGTRPEMLALVAAADELGRHDIGDSVVMGLWTGQRQGDRLALRHHGKLKGRRVFRQNKTAAIVHVLEAPELEARIAASAARRKAKEIVDPHVLLNEATWEPWQEDTYRHEFAAVREHAARACPSLASFRDQDLRDTAVTWMALAGSTIPEIIAVTGHSPETAHAILKHYLARHPEMADTAIRKMITWFDGNGETEFG
jgi:integrase